MPDESADRDVNVQVTEEWVAETTPFERVRSVVKRTYEPQPPPAIADRAETTATTARTHLRQLEADGFVDEIPSGGNRVQYRRSSESVVLEQAHDILTEVGSTELVERIGSMREEIAAYRDEFDAESPEDAAIRGEINRETLRAWQTTRRNLEIARAALALENAEEAVQLTDAV